MQSQLERSLGHGCTEEQLNAPVHHSAGSWKEDGVDHEYDEGHDDQDHENKSVLKKVKAKVTKIKNTIKMHTPGRHDHEHGGEHHDYEEEEEDEEMEQDPAVHGVPRLTKQYGITNSRGDPTGRGDNNQSAKEAREEYNARLNMTPIDPSYATTHPENAQHRPALATATYHPAGTPHDSASGAKAHHETNRGLGSSKRGPAAAGLRGFLEEWAVLEEDPHGPGAKDRYENYQTKVADPTGRGTSLGTQQGASYTEKLSSAAGAVANKAAQAKNAVTSKLGYGAPDTSTEHTASTEGEHTSAADTRGRREETAAGSVGDSYGKKLVESAYDKVMSKMQDPKAEAVDAEKVDVSVGSNNNTGKLDEGISAKQYFFDKLRPREEDRVLSEVVVGALRSERRGKKKEGIRGIRVAEPEEVIRGRLGCDDRGKAACEDDGGGSGGGDGSGRTVVDRSKGEMTDWFG